MTASVMFFMTLIFPLAAIVTGVKMKVTPYRVIITGALYSAMGALLVLAFMYAIGNGAGAKLSELITQMTNEVTANKEFMQALGLSGKSSEEATAYITNIYTTSMQLIPSMIVAWGAVVSYVEYRIVSASMRRRMVDVVPMTPIREFHMHRNAFFGWMLLYALTFLLQYSGSVDMATALYVNVFAVMRLAFAYQGISYFAYLSYMKRWPKAIWPIVTIILIAVAYGITLFYILGVIDCIFNLKGRVGVKRA